MRRDFRLKPVDVSIELWDSGSYLNLYFRQLSLKLLQWGKEWESVALLISGEGQEGGPPSDHRAGVLLTRPPLTCPWLAGDLVISLISLHCLCWHHRERPHDGEQSPGLPTPLWPFSNIIPLRWGWVCPYSLVSGHIHFASARVAGVVTTVFFYLVF